MNTEHVLVREQLCDIDGNCMTTNYYHNRMNPDTSLSYSGSNKVDDYYGYMNDI